MERNINFLTELLDQHAWLQSLTAFLGLMIAALIANGISKHVVVRLVTHLIAASPLRDESVYLARIVTHLSNVVPALIIQQGIPLVPYIPLKLLTVTQNLAAAFIVLTIAMALNDALDLVNDTYEQRSDEAERPIKGYVQIGKMFVIFAAAILMIAAVLNQSPVILLSGLGALAAVLMLIFRDTILSLVASVQMRSNDMLRVGDWIEMPQLAADGDVIDIALHTVKIQNFDKTITTIPTHRLISESFRNWRGMYEAGARRIKRALYIDQACIDFLTPEQWQAMGRFRLLAPYVERKQAELDAWNAQNAGTSGEAVNRRRPTNIGTFRAYVAAYLKAHPAIAQDKTMLVRHLPPGEKGLPLEIYCFANTTAWAEYEAIQADIFDHLLSILPEFGLALFQQPSGHDVKDIARNAALSPA